MLSRAQQVAALAERIISGSLAQTTSQANCCSVLAWSLSRPAQRQAHHTFLSTFSTAAVEAPMEDAPGLNIHPSAAARLRKLQAEQPATRLALRVEVEGGGCSGFQYKFNLDEQIKNDDVLFEVDGARVVCDIVSLEFLRGATLAFEDTLMRAAFSISKNPNAEASCGCGSSFAAKLK